MESPPAGSIHHCVPSEPLGTHFRMNSSTFSSLSEVSTKGEFWLDDSELRSWPESLRRNVSVLSAEEQRQASMLLSLGQHHLFGSWADPGTDDALKHLFFHQIRDLDDSYAATGGISAYIQRARILLASSKAGDNPFEGWRPEVPSGVNLEPLTSEYEKYEQLGIPELGACGFVLVAGGLGERLGYNGIKVELPSQTLTNVSYLELYCSQILATQQRYAKPGMKLPLAIMVSDDTMSKTVTLLERNDYFGLERDQVTLMKQGKVPALLSNAAHIAMSSAYAIDAKPHGHGDVHSLMHSTGTAVRWQQMGVRWAVFFQDTNGLAFFTLPAMLGVSVELSLEVNSLAIKRFAKQAIGAITKLVHSSGKEMTVNVEYNQLDPLLRATVSPEGDVNLSLTGASPYPGNINQLLFQLDAYVVNLQESDGLMPEFVNPKYADDSKIKFKKPTRLECMMQDYPKLLKPGSRVGFTSAPSWICYSPCKNNTLDAAASIANGIPAASAYTAECDQFLVFCEILRRMGVIVEAAAPLTVDGVVAVPGPRLVFDPSFAMYPHEIRERFPRYSKLLNRRKGKSMGSESVPDYVKISARSALVISGDVVVDTLSLDGSLIVKAAPMTRVTLKARFKGGVINEGHNLRFLRARSNSNQNLASRSISERIDIMEWDLMRGYVIECIDCASAISKDPSISQKDTLEYVYTGSAEGTLIGANAYDDSEEVAVAAKGTTASFSGTRDDGICSICSLS